MHLYETTIRRKDEDGVLRDYLMREVSNTPVTGVTRAKELIALAEDADEAVALLAGENLIVE